MTAVMKVLTESGWKPWGGGSSNHQWVRPADWLPMPDMNPGPGVEKVAALHPVSGKHGWTALTAEGDYTVDWGDGNIEDFASGVTAEHVWNFDDLDPDSLTSQGFRQALVIITPQDGQHITSLTFDVSHSALTNNYAHDWLDIVGELPNVVTLTISYNLYAARVQRIVFGDLPSATDLSYFASSCYALQTLTVGDLPSATDLSSFASSCYALQTLTVGDLPSATDLSYFASYCQALQTLTVGDLPSATNLSSFASYCYALQTLVVGATASNLDVNAKQLDHDALVALFTALNDGTGVSVTITNNPGVADLTGPDRAIATDKNWTIVDA